ncbi:acyl-CoA N-acyltransferase [Polychaeton citri CBS 116435]|uniref:Acyl-CoA N-acyltransferase n=1 Tax=Polychaeton citri CBS 116435 TaxID=1314669 RepID=A0A9P4Q7H0_9PEZI|nr:acyl-CoA N-acyltransferase [Polychaeton citri CBS 116435]
MANPFQSERLIYRAVEEEDDAFFNVLNSDPVSYMNSAPFLPVPLGKAGAKGYREWLDSCILGVVICLPAPAPAAIAAATTTTTGLPATALATPDVSKPIPIGAISLSGTKPGLRHHRNTMIGLNIAGPYQGQGYGSEAIKWALRWAFKRAGMHKVEIGAFSYNEGAVRLYDRLGFKEEGRKRQQLWHDGQWHDIVESGMLEDEWRELYGEQA